MKIKSVTPHVASVDVSHATKHWLRREYFEGLCRKCPNYGTRWGCPPLTGTWDYKLEDFKTLEITALRIELDDIDGESSTPDMVSEMTDIISDIRREWEPKLLKKEQENCGKAALFTGMCPHCPGRECARVQWHECRHPELVRPSLEALGFDLTAMLRDVFGLEMQWAAGCRPPEYLMLIGGVFYGRS